MRKRQLAGLAVLVILTAAGVGAGPAEAPAGSEAFAGEWVGDAQARGLAAINVSGKGDRWKIRIWGMCKPVNCDWGERELRMLTDSISGGTITHAFAVWEKDDATRCVKLSVDGGVLFAEVIVLWVDSAGRRDYRRVERLTRRLAPR